LDEVEGRFCKYLKGKITKKKGNIYIAARVGSRKPKNLLEKTIISTLFTLTKLIAEASLNSFLLKMGAKYPAMRFKEPKRSDANMHWIIKLGL
jgi:H2-forming N5,N10-methylenetetrahydromethanopterin dehydrogenase-like enzyme